MATEVAKKSGQVSRLLQGSQAILLARNQAERLAVQLGSFSGKLLAMFEPKIRTTHPQLTGMESTAVSSYQLLERFPSPTLQEQTHSNPLLLRPQLPGSATLILLDWPKDWLPSSLAPESCSCG